MIAAAARWTFPQALAAQSQMPRDISHVTPAGNYLAARQANLERDADAASVYYRAALRTDQRNPELLELAFYSVLADGDIEEAVRLAERLISARSQQPQCASRAGRQSAQDQELQGCAPAVRASPRAAR